MMEYKFSSKNGYCPKCSVFGRTWYIQDREIGEGKYEYCLMSVTEDEPKKYEFQNKSDLAKWLNEDQSNAVYEAAVADMIISRWTDWRANYSDKALIVWHNTEYIYDKCKNTLTAIQERKQETGWHDSYHECLKVAKTILEKQEIRNAAS